VCLLAWNGDPVVGTVVDLNPNLLDVIHVLQCLQAVPYSLSLATIKKFIWKRSDDVVFHYKALDPARLAPFPTTFQSPEP
jgi:hypothetical protein